MTPEQVMSIMEDDSIKYDENASENGFLEGLNLLNFLSEYKGHYNTGCSVFFGDDLKDLPNIKKEDVIKLKILGWDYDCKENYFQYIW